MIGLTDKVYSGALLTNVVIELFRDSVLGARDKLGLGVADGVGVVLLSPWNAVDSSRISTCPLLPPVNQVVEIIS